MEFPYASSAFPDKPHHSRMFCNSMQKTRTLLNILSFVLINCHSSLLRLISEKHRCFPINTSCTTRLNRFRMKPTRNKGYISLCDIIMTTCNSESSVSIHVSLKHVSIPSTQCAYHILYLAGFYLQKHDKRKYNFYLENGE